MLKMLHGRVFDSLKATSLPLVRDFCFPLPLEQYILMPTKLTKRNVLTHLRYFGHLVSVHIFRVVFHAEVLTNECWHCSWFRFVYLITCILYAREWQRFFPPIAIHGKTFSIFSEHVSLEMSVSRLQVRRRKRVEASGIISIQCKILHLALVLTNFSIFSFFPRSLPLAFSPSPYFMEHGSHFCSSTKHIISFCFVCFIFTS